LLQLLGILNTRWSEPAEHSCGQFQAQQHDGYECRYLAGTGGTGP
jgi:hypothetical protein